MSHAIEKQVLQRFAHTFRRATVSISRRESSSRAAERFCEIAIPAALQLAKQLRQPPRQIAAELVKGVGPIPGVASMEIAGNVYNLRLDHGAYGSALLRGMRRSLAARLHS